MTNKKFRCLISILILTILILVGAPTVSAMMRGTTYYYTDVSVRSGYSDVSIAYCDEEGGVSYIHITDAEPSNVNYIVRVVDQTNNHQLGNSDKIFGLGSTSIKTDTVSGKNYLLQIGREYFWDGPGIVSGYWSP